MTINDDSDGPSLARGDLALIGFHSTDPDDFAFVRLFAPVRGRVDPFVDLGGGMVFLESARPGLPLDVGGSLRASVGFDAWLTKTITLGISGLYRAVFVGDSIGHTIQGAVELAVHF